MDLRKWGPYIFLIGFVIAILIGVAGQSLDADNYTMLLGVLVVLGLVVGIVNISEEEAVPFLIASIALLQVDASLNVLEGLPAMADVLPIVTAFVAALIVFVLPAALIVALKAIYDLAGEGAIEQVEKSIMRPAAVAKKK